MRVKARISGIIDEPVYLLKEVSLFEDDLLTPVGKAVKHNKKVTVIDVKEEYCKIKTLTKTGWIPKRYLTIV